MNKEIKSEDLQIKKMQSIHVEEIYKIEEEAFFTPWSKKSIISEVKNPIGRYIVIVYEEQVIAYGGFWLVLEDANINNIAVKEEYRGKGIAKILMNTLISMAKKEGAKNMYLEVRQSNINAQGLYRMLNFKMVGLRKGYYVDTNEDAIVMELNLDIADMDII